MKENKKEIQQLYEELLRPSDVLTISTIDRQILIDAAKIRASSDAILLPDAIHLASARNQNCSSFITNDKRLRKIDSFQVVILSEL
jgi:predicted nucleic acid-binding protein